MPIINDISAGLYRIEIVFLHFFNDSFIWNNLVLADYNPLGLMFYLAQVVPFTGSDLWDFESRLWVYIQNVS